MRWREGEHIKEDCPADGHSEGSGCVEGPDIRRLLRQSNYSGGGAGTVVPWPEHEVPSQNPPFSKAAAGGARGPE
ncbi:MAG TPA: hypothetical protein VFN35_19315 [Ktedonobacteraceae bacterium]|nr:hypothetical protein [Ktedonobacteraceae bacterium]